MADLFSNVPIPQPLNTLQKPKASDSPLVSILSNDRQRRFEAFKLAEEARINDMNSLAGFKIGELGQSFGGLFQAQVDRAKEMMLRGGMTPAESKSLVLNLVRDYEKYKMIHVNPFQEVYGLHASLSTDPKLLDQYNYSLPVGQQYNPMQIEELGIIKDDQMNKLFNANDPTNPVTFDPITGDPMVYDPKQQTYVKPEMVSGIGKYDELFANRIQPQDIGTLYDWGQEAATQKVVTRRGVWHEGAANDYFDLSIGLKNRSGAIHRAQLLDTYENELGTQYMTDKQREAFINMNPQSEEYTSLFDESGKPIGLAATLLGDEGRDLWKKATYFEPVPDAQRRQDSDAYRTRNLLINSGREDIMPIYSVPSTARLIGKIGDDDTIPLMVQGEMQYAIPRYHYIDAQGRHVLKASIVSETGESESVYSGGLATSSTIDVPLEGVNYDAVDRYIRSKHGGATLEDLRAGKLPKAYDSNEAPLNAVWGSLDVEEGGSMGYSEKENANLSIQGVPGSPYRLRYQVDQERYESALSSVRQMLKQYPEASRIFAAQGSMFAGISNPNITADKNLEILVKDLVDAGYSDSQISTAISTPEFYTELKKIGYRPAGRGTTDRLRRLLEFIVSLTGFETGTAKQRKNVKQAAENTIESMAYPEYAPDYTGIPGFDYTPEEDPNWRPYTPRKK